VNATQKMDALTIKALHERVQALRPETSLVTIYRWRRAMEDGRGVSDANKRLLIDATRETEHALDWPDFVPREADGGEAVQ
jgi:Fe2+ or Zn2+ uptake regulation protein